MERMDTVKETFDTWNKIAGLYEEKFMDLDLYNEGYDFFCASLSTQNPGVLELGCGPGNITRHLLQRRPDMSILATDIAPNMIELAKKNNPNAEFKLMDARALCQLNKTFDGIVAGFCLPYLSAGESAQLIQDAYESMFEKGIFYLSFIEGDPAKSGWMTGSTNDRVYFYYHNGDTLLQELRKAGFVILKTFNIPYTKSTGESELHDVLIVQKF
jgi:SAM-dependent methyltransferase